MNEIYMKALESIYKIITGGKAYDLIIETVSGLMDEDYSNDEKRQMVKDAVMPFVNEFGKAMLSAVIAFAVSSLKTQMEENVKV